jgi:CRISPR-associated protein Cas1
MLNYGYAVLESWVRKYICSVGLDQSIGFLHHMRASNTPLVYDLLELYRWMVDLSVLQLLEDKKLKKSDFIVTEHYHTRLQEHTAKLLIGKLQLNLNRRVPYKNKQFMYDGVLQDNVQILANYIQNKQTELQFNIPTVKIGRDDTIEMREAILRMTPKQRKELGISKTTLWCMQKNLREGKQIKIYEKTKGKMDISSD